MMIEAQDLNQAVIKHGIVWVYSRSNGNGIYQGTLSDLQKLLPNHLFFSAGRNMIIHRDIIRSLSSSSFGKIDVEIDTHGDKLETITISRQKAAAFRKWYHTTST